MAMIDYGGSGGSGSTAPSGDDEEESTTFDTSTQTLGTTSIGTSTGSDDETSFEVTTSDPDPDSSSPAGGAGATTATANFAGVDEDDLGDDTEDVIDVAQEASDEWTERMRFADRVGLDIDPAEAVGSIFDDRSVLEAQAAEIQEAIVDRAPSIGVDQLRDRVGGFGLVGTILAFGAIAIVAVAGGAGE